MLRPAVAHPRPFRHGARVEHQEHPERARTAPAHSLRGSLRGRCRPRRTGSSRSDSSPVHPRSAPHPRRPCRRSRSSPSLTWLGDREDLRDRRRRRPAGRTRRGRRTRRRSRRRTGDRRSRPRAAAASSACAVPPAAEVAWTDVIPPAPLLSASSMSSVSAPRTSPTTIRSGRMRRTLADQIAERDRALALEVRLPALHRRPRRAASIRSSNTSSQVTMRSRAGIAAARQLSSVVLPGPDRAGDHHDRARPGSTRRGTRLRPRRARAECDELVERLRPQVRRTCGC